MVEMLNNFLGQYLGIYIRLGLYDYMLSTLILTLNTLPYLSDDFNFMSILRKCFTGVPRTYSCYCEITVVLLRIMVDQ